jgi:hypothetical protein
LRRAAIGTGIISHEEKEQNARDMTLLWFVAIASLLAALVAWRQARGTARRLEQLSQMYWELKYQHGELRVQLQRIAPPDAAAATSTSAAGPSPPSQERPADGFIPLSSLKR